jgi:hypothetical protein
MKFDQAFEIYARVFGSKGEDQIADSFMSFVSSRAEADGLLSLCRSLKEDARQQMLLFEFGKQPKQGVVNALKQKYPSASSATIDEAVKFGDRLVSKG